MLAKSVIPIYTFVKHYLHFASLKLLPSQCLFCQQTQRGTALACSLCLKDLPQLTTYCACCANDISYDQASLCGKCLAHPPLFDITHALYPYVHPITVLIKRLKYGQQLTLAKFFAQEMFRRLQLIYTEHYPQVIIPMPLHASRLAERGFNQATEIAKHLSKLLHIPLNLGVTRIKATAAQSQLNAKARAINMKQAFTTQVDFTAMHVAVLDDIVTTGASAQELCKTLRKAGAKRIDIWCCAKAR